MALNNSILEKKSSKKKDSSLKYEEWDQYITERKLLLINELEDKTYLAKVEDNVKFMKIMKNITNTNILNLTYIGYLFVKFLENSYVDEHIILNSIELHSIEKYFIQSKDNVKYIDNLKCLINTIPDIIIKLDFSFNIHFLILLYFLKQLKKINKINSNTSNLINIIDNLQNQVNESSIILLFFKLIRNITNIQTFDMTNEFVVENRKYLDRCKKNLKEQDEILDKFMLSINSENIYEVCNKYVLDMVRIIFQEMKNIFQCVIEYLMKSENINEIKKNNLISLENVMNNFLEMEKENIIKIFNDI